MFQDAACIVTGAGSGIDRALAWELYDRGAIVSAADIDRSAVDSVAHALENSGGRISPAEVDVTDPDAVTRLVQGVHDMYGRIDFMFNNAGVNVAAEIDDTTLDHWDRLINVNLMGVVHGDLAAYPLMRARGSGHIVNTGSMAGLSRVYTQRAYGATTHAAVGLSQVLRIEAADSGVRVSVVCPGVVQTPMLQNIEQVNVDQEKILNALSQRPYPVDKAARGILRGVQRNQGVITVPSSATASWLAYRFLPGPVFVGLQRLVVRRLRKLSARSAID